MGEVIVDAGPEIWRDWRKYDPDNVQESFEIALYSDTNLQVTCADRIGRSISFQPCQISLDSGLSWRWLPVWCGTFEP
jgi:hypothetical protein